MPQQTGQWEVSKDSHSPVIEYLVGTNPFEVVHDPLAVVADFASAGVDPVDLYVAQALINSEGLTVLNDKSAYRRV